MTMYRRALLAALCAVLFFSGVAGAQAWLTVEAGDATISFQPWIGTIGAPLTAQGSTILRAQIKNHEGRPFKVTASTTAPPSLTFDNISRLIRLAVSLDGGAFFELVTQLGAPLQNVELGYVDMPLRNTWYEWPLVYEATMFIEDMLPVGSHVFSVLYTVIDI